MIPILANNNIADPPSSKDPNISEFEKIRSQKIIKKIQILQNWDKLVGKKKEAGSRAKPGLC